MIKQSPVTLLVLRVPWRDRRYELVCGHFDRNYTALLSAHHVAAGMARPAVAPSDVSILGFLV